MAGILNLIYLIAVVLVATIGLAFAGRIVLETEVDGSKWLERSAIVLGIVFILALGVQFAS